MQVETYEALEVDCEGNVESDSEAVALIEKLGLAGQQKLIRRTESGGGTIVSRNPYRKLTAEESFVYRELCPEQCKVAEYDAGPIPLRVLQVAAHAADHFKELQVWAATSVAIKDPVLVGVKTERVAGRSWDDTVTFILARWGDVLEPFDKLLEKASASFRARHAGTCNTIIAKARAAAAEIEACPVSELFTKSMPTFYG
jgi:hypothetical protein